MAIAQRISKQTTIRKQTGLGVPGSNTGQILRRTSSIFTAARDMYTSNEVRSDHQSSGQSYGLKSVSGTINGELSASTYQLLIEAMLEAPFAATTPYAAGTDVTPNSAGTFTDASAGYLTAGIKTGDVGRWTGFTSSAAANNSKNFLVTSITAGVMTGVFLNGDAVVSASAGDNVTFTVAGKKCKTPLTGHTKDYLQVEEYYSDMTDSDLFSDLVVSGLTFDMPASDNATMSATLAGLTRALSGSQVMTSPTAETQTGIMSSINGRIYVNGTAIPITGLNIQIANGAAPTGAEIGSNVSGDVFRQQIVVTGQFMAMLRDQTVSALYDAETEISLFAAMAESEEDAANFMAFSIPKIKITGDAPDDSDAIMRTYPFSARLNVDGGAALAFDKTTITIQDSAAA
jgi:plastocyanin